MGVSFLVCFVTGLLKYSVLLQLTGLNSVVLPFALFTDLHDWSGILMGILCLPPPGAEPQVDHLHHKKDPCRGQYRLLRSIFFLRRHPDQSRVKLRFISPEFEYPRSSQ